MYATRARSQAARTAAGVSVLTQREFRAWARRLGLSQAAISEITLIRTTPPGRRIRSGASNVCCRFPSAKMGHVIQAESHTVELPFVHAAEQDPAVLELWDQPRQDWTMPLHYRSKTGHPVVAHHTPDFFELRQDAAGWVECKPQERLLVLAAEQPHRYCVGERGQWWCPSGQAYAAQLGLTYRVFSSAEINWTAQRNWAYLTDYFDGSCPTVDHATLRRVLSVVAQEPGIRLAQLQERLSGLVSADDLNILIATARLFVDLGIYALAEPEYVPVFRDPEMAAAHVIMTMPAARLDVGIPRQLTVEEGAAVRWDGRPWTIGAVTDTYTTLVSEQGAPVQLLTAVFDRYIGEGQIQGIGETIEQGVTEEGRALVANASIEDQAQANQRYAVLQPERDGHRPVIEDATHR